MGTLDVPIINQYRSSSLGSHCFSAPVIVISPWIRFNSSSGMKREIWFFSCHVKWHPPAVCHPENDCGTPLSLDANCSFLPPHTQFVFEFCGLSPPGQRRTVCYHDGLCLPIPVIRNIGNLHENCIKDSIKEGGNWLSQTLPRQAIRCTR